MFSRLEMLSRWALSLGASCVLACPPHPVLTHSCFSSRKQQRPPGGGGGGGGGPKSHNPQQQAPPHSHQQHQSGNQTHQIISELHSEGFNTKHGYGGRGYQSGQQGRGYHHGYSQNRRWHQQHRQPGQQNAKDADGIKEEGNERKVPRATDNARGDDDDTGDDNRKNDRKQEKTEGGKVILLQSSKERLRRRLKEKVSWLVGGASNIDAPPLHSDAHPNGSRRVQERDRALVIVVSRACHPGCPVTHFLP